MSMPPIHPAAELFPMMSDEELRALADDIKANGLQQPVVLYGAQLLDGRNRWRACEMAGVEVRTKDWAGKDAVAYVRSLNLHRRHLTAAQRAALAVKVEPVYAEAAAVRQKDEGRKAGAQGGRGKKNPQDGNRPKGKQDEQSRALAQAAKETGASLDSAKAMKQVDKVAPEVVELVQRGKVDTVADAKRIAALPDEQRAEVVERVRAGTSVSEAFTVAGAIQKVREQRETPIGQVIAAIESVRKHATSLRGACARLEDLASSLDVTEMRSPEFSRAGMALLQARAEITAVINKLRIKETQ
jgi:ParB-like chromosome segregation protein Spo0J